MRKTLSTHLIPPPALRRASPLFRRLPLKGGVMLEDVGLLQGRGVLQREGTHATLSVLALGAGAAELAAVFLLDGL